jgi:hypothetical protein
MLFPPGSGIGAYFGISLISHPTSVHIFSNGATAALVISSADSAAMTAIHNTARARKFIIIVPIIHLPVSRIHDPTLAVFSPRTHMVVNSTSQNVNVCSDSQLDQLHSAIFTISEDKEFVSDPIHWLIVADKNISQNAKAADTYTGTIARDINHQMLNLFFLNISQAFHSHLKKYARANKGENIAYTHNLATLLNIANTIATSNILNIIKNISQNHHFFAISNMLFIHLISVGSMLA